MAKFSIHRTDDGLYGLQLATVNLADIFHANLFAAGEKLTNPWVAICYRHAKLDR
jgi:hypothetical protein